jgi:hypothetical protein
MVMIRRLKSLDEFELIGLGLAILSGLLMALPAIVFCMGAK